MPLRQLDDSLRHKNGTVTAMDGTMYPTGWPAPRLLSPIFSYAKVRCLSMWLSLPVLTSFNLSIIAL